jgi:hypothetical protein
MMVAVMCWLILRCRLLDEGPPHYIAVARALSSVCVKLPRLIHKHRRTSVRAMDWTSSREQRLDWTREQWLDSLTTVLCNSLHND